ncbi:MAG: pyruvate kinase [Pseudomonadota bacterium]|nr:pyruvate kinase [Pseudomonadota bacterium]
MPRRTKIVATLGPASESREVLEAIIRAGVDVVRLNFSHGSAEEHIRRAQMVREIAAVQGRAVGVLADLQGPKIRIDRFRNGPVDLAEGRQFTLDAEMAADAGHQEAVGIAYKTLPQDVSPGNILLLDDGKIVLKVDQVMGQKVVCTVEVGGKLSDRKGINLMGGGLSAPALTDKDKQDIRTAAQLQADYVAVSFPKDADDMHQARQLLRDAGGLGGVVSKIERWEALQVIEQIIEASDGVMVARGDLAVEIGDAEVPGWQKRLIKMSRDMNRVVITATQMMESMITTPTPTRAEVSDVANAVLDGTDAVMLSAESASGKYPVKAVEALVRVCLAAEKERVTQISAHRMNLEFRHIDEAIAMATMYTANHLKVRAIACLTESGSTTRWLSRIRSGIPIYALTRHEATRRRVTLYRGVYPIDFDITSPATPIVMQGVMDTLKAKGAVQDGDLIIVTRGDFTGIAGRTNTMKILRVGEDLSAHPSIGDE